MPAIENLVRLPENVDGRDFCVGDIHGMYDLLDNLLASVNFDQNKDRLISVGDLVDRGPDSNKALIYLNQPWFHAIRGNHEQLLIDCVENPEDTETLNIWLRNGGQWWEQQSKAIHRALYRRIKQLPIALEIPTQRGMIGIVHADIPENISWERFCDAIRQGNKEVITHSLWSRRRAKNATTAEPVEGILEIYCGHTIVDMPITAGNMHFIDTGAYMGKHGRLTLVDLGQGPEFRYSLSASK